MDNDLISRQAAIDALKEHRALYCDNTPDTFSKLSYAEKSRVDELDMAIATLINLPSAQPEPRWIPCSERLPEDNSDILVTYVEKDEKRIAPVNYGCGTWFDCLFNKVLDQVGVLAWMPLPEPYKTESEVQDADSN